MHLNLQRFRYKQVVLLKKQFVFNNLRFGLKKYVVNKNNRNFKFVKEIKTQIQNQKRLTPEILLNFINYKKKSFVKNNLIASSII